MSLKQLTEVGIEQATEAALNAACLSIQNTIGQSDGGVAGVFFSGGNGERFKAMMRAYIELEYSLDTE